MVRKNWDKIADQEFASMDTDEQHSFADLRDRVKRRDERRDGRWHIANLWD